MASPTKRRKKNTAPQQSRNLDFFFGKQRQPAAAATPPPKPDFESTTEGLTDEELAQKLAGEWAKEDRAVPPESRDKEGGSKPGIGKRRRSSSPAIPSDNTAKPTIVDERAERKDDPERTKAPENTPDEEKQTVTIPPTPRKIAVSIEAALESDILTEEMPFDKDPLLFDPDACESIVEKWPAGKAPYMLLTRAFVLVNSTRSRIKIVDTLVNLIRTLIRLDPESLLAAVSFDCTRHLGY